MLILLLILVLPYGVNSYPVGQCNKKTGRKQWFCCDNHEEVNGNCIKCVNGFESFDGSPCKPCPKGLWGEECANRCSCTKDQICDHILGCINIQIDMPEETTGLHNEIFIYSICAGAFAFVILLYTVCQRHYKQIYNYFIRNTPDNDRITNVQENILEDVPSVEIEGKYEVIDESNMIDNFDNTENLDVHATKDETECPLDSNSYPNRYRPVKKDPNINNSNRSKSVFF